MNSGLRDLLDSLPGRFLLAWLPFAAVLTIVGGLIYGSVQQDLRLGANDPQIQMAEDAAAALQAGQAAQALVPTATVDMAASLAPYLLVFDAAGKPVVGSARLNGTMPSPPSGVFTDVRQGGEDRFTWEPAPGVRSAAVVTRIDGPTPGFVLAGRSLREVEQRETQMEQLAALAWLAGLVVTALLCGLQAWVGFRRPAPVG